LEGKKAGGGLERAATSSFLRRELRLSLALAARGREEQRFRAREWSGEGVEWCEGVERLGEGFL
jgi:hypothetical protein